MEKKLIKSQLNELLNTSRLGDLIHFMTGVDSKGNVSSTKSQNSLPWVKLGSLCNGRVNIGNCEWLINEEKNVAKNSDLLVCWSTNAGLPVKVKFTCLFSTAFYKIDNTEDYILNDYLYYWFQKNKSIIQSLTDGSSLKKINMKKFAKVIINYPSILEQQKIAKFFTLLDKQIELWERKLQLNELVKQYYLNQLFINSIKYGVVPKLRFKGFKEEWSNKRILEIITDILPTQLSEYFWDAPAIINKKYSIFNNEIHNIAPIDSIVFIKDGSNAGSFAYNSIDCRIASTCSYIFTNQNNKFIYYILEKLSKKIKVELLTGETIPHLYKKDILLTKIIISKNKIEQDKISKFFSSLDKISNKITMNINNLIKIKKYYLHNLFI